MFGDADEDTVKSRAELKESRMDDEGKASVDVDLSPVAKPPFTLHRARHAEPARERRPSGGAQHRARLLAAPVLVGLRPMFVGAYAREGAPVEFEVVRSDAAAGLKAARRCR